MTTEPTVSHQPGGEGECDPYLWNGSGRPDEQVRRMERALRAYRYEVRGAPAARPGRLRLSRRIFIPLAAAAALALAAGAGWMAWDANRPAWEVTALAGTPVIRTSKVEGGGFLKVGQWLKTDSASSAQLSVKDVGTVTVDPDSRLRLVEATKAQQRLQLERGRIHATIFAPPRLFLVDTPSALATDLGCQYTLTVDDTGAGLLDVTLGYVELSAKGVDSTVPAGALCRTWPNKAPGLPRSTDAPEALVRALDSWELHRGGDAALDVILGAARPRDSLTLWHLLSRVSVEKRQSVYDRLAIIAPPPKTILAADVLNLDKAALKAWWEELPRYW